MRERWRGPENGKTQARVSGVCEVSGRRGRTNVRQAINYLEISKLDKHQIQPRLASIIKSFKADLRSLSGMCVLWHIRKTAGMSGEISSKFDNVSTGRVLTDSWETVILIKTICQSFTSNY